MSKHSPPATREQSCAQVIAALRELRSACDYVSPIVGAVATEASVKHIRQAAKFMAACRKADAALAKASPCA